MKRPGRPAIVWLLVGSLTLAVALTTVLVVLDAALSERTGLRRQVSQLSERTREDGPLLLDDIAPTATLDFLQHNAELPRRFFRTRWAGYWYVPQPQQVDIYGVGDDRLDVRIDDRLVLRRPGPSGMQTVTLDRGIHELRVDYEQHGGVAGMSLRWAPHGGSSRAIHHRRLFHERPGDTDLLLSSSVVWLRQIVLLAWLAPIPIVLVLWTRRKPARTERLDASPATSPLPRRDIALLAGLCAAIFVYGVGNLSVRPAADDGYQNLTLGLRLVDTGEYGRDGRDAFREPFMPVIWGVMDRASQWIGLEPVPRDCMIDNVSPCRSIYARLKIVNLVFLVAGAAVAFALVRRLTGSAWLACGAFLLAAQNGQLLMGVDRFYTEPHAATLLILTAFFAFRMFHRRRPTDGVWLGLVLAALVLTKVVFVYLWIFIALAFVTLDALDRGIGQSTALLVAVFLASHLVPVGAWMARNHSAVGAFTVVEGRQTGVLLTREAYHNMRDDEFAAAFWYYLPVTKNRLGDLGIAAQSIERIAPMNANSFRRRQNRGADPSALDVQSRLLTEPWQHLKISLLLAWRGVFLARSVAGPSPPDRDLGYSPRPRGNTLRLAEQWELLLWPRWGVPFNTLLSTILHLAGFLSLLVVPAWFWLARKRFDVVLIALPALYCHGVYAVATHFIPRYADPETPLRSVTAMLLVFLVASLAGGRQPREDEAITSSSTRVPDGTPSDGMQGRPTARARGTADS